MHSNLIYVERDACLYSLAYRVYSIYLLVSLCFTCVGFCCGSYGNDVQNVQECTNIRRIKTICRPYIYIYIYSVLWQRCADTIKQTDPQKDELSRRETQFMTLPGKAMHAGTECLWCRYDICVSVYNRRTHQKEYTTTASLFARRRLICRARLYRVSRCRTNKRGGLLFS